MGQEGAKEPSTKRGTENEAHSVANERADYRYKAYKAKKQMGTIGFGQIVAKYGEDQKLNENPIVTYDKYTDTSRWRPQIINSTLEAFAGNVALDVGNIFSVGLNAWFNSTTKQVTSLDNLFANVFLSILAPFVVIPAMVPLAAIALPFIMIKNATPMLLPAMAFEISAKALLTAAFVVQHPAAVAQAVTRKAVQLFRGNSNTSSAPPE
jgi:hypothetical protein